MYQTKYKNLMHVISNDPLQLELVHLEYQYPYHVIIKGQKYDYKIVIGRELHS